jgi:hypothetical protein
MQLVFLSEKSLKTSVFGNFVIKIQSKSPQIGNFVIKNTSFDPFLALAKNLTRLGRQTKSNKQQLKNRRSKPC